MTTTTKTPKNSSKTPRLDKRDVAECLLLLCGHVREWNEGTKTSAELREVFRLFEEHAKTSILPAGRLSKTRVQEAMMRELDLAWRSMHPHEYRWALTTLNAA